MRRSIFAIVVGVGFVSLSQNAYGAEYYVPADFPTIQQGIEAANHGDIIWVSPGVYRERLNFLGKAVRVRSEFGPDKTIIDGQRQGTVVTLTENEPPGAILRGFTIRGGRGGGAFPDVSGGGITCSSRATIWGNIIIDNVAEFGGGVYCAEGSGLSLRENVIFGNSAIHGGGVYCASDATPEFNANQFVGNQASARGGALAIEKGNPLVTSSVFASNLADFGGAVSIDDSVPSFEFNTFYGNNALRAGGGLWCRFSEVDITHSILWNNISPSGPSMWIGEQFVFSKVSFAHGDVQGGTTSIVIADSDSILEWGPGMIDQAPLFRAPQHLDFTLELDSPCLDAGDPTDRRCLRDLLGHPRRLDANLDGQAIVDLGALERAHASLALEGDTTPGGDIIIATDATPGLTTILFVGTSRATICLDEIGSLYFGLSTPWISIPWSGGELVTTIPSNIPPPLSLVLQALALDPVSPTGTLSNAIGLDIR